MYFTLVVGGKNVPYIVQYIDCQWKDIGSQWGECPPLYWQPVGRMPLILMVIGMNAPYISGQWEECFINWGPVRRMLLALMDS